MYVAYKWVIRILFEIHMIIINHYNLRPKHYNLKHSIYGDVSRSIWIITKPGQKVFLIVSILYWRLMLSLTEMWYSSNVSVIENLVKLNRPLSQEIQMNYDVIIFRLYISTTKTTPRWKHFRRFFFGVEISRKSRLFGQNFDFRSLKISTIWIHNDKYGNGCTHHQYWYGVYWWD